MRQGYKKSSPLDDAVNFFGPVKADHQTPAVARCTTGMPAFPEDGKNRSLAQGQAVADFFSTPVPDTSVRKQKSGFLRSRFFYPMLTH